MPRHLRFDKDTFGKYYAMSKSIKQLAEFLHCSPLTVRNYCERYGFKTDLRDPGTPGTKNTSLIRPAESIDALYLIAGPSKMRTIHRTGPFAKELYPQFRRRIANALNWLYDPSFPERLAADNIPAVLSVKPPIRIPALKAWNTVRVYPELFNKEPDIIGNQINCVVEEFLPYLDECYNNNLLIQEKETKYAQT